MACPASDQEPRQPPPLVVEPTPSPVADADREPKPELEQVIEIATDDPTLDPTAVPIKPVAPASASVTWRELGSFVEPDLKFIHMATGVVARSSAGIHELDADDQLRLMPELTLPVGTLVGQWPADAWSIDAQPVAPGEDGLPRFEYRAWRFDTPSRTWVEHAYRGKAAFFGEAAAVRKGWHAGLLVRDSSTLTRLGSVKPAPKIGMRMGKQLLDTFETSSGQLYTISQRPTGVHVQIDCPDFACVKQNAKKLPLQRPWSFTQQVPRRRKSLTIAARVDIDGSPAHYLLHFEVGGWKLESLERGPSGLWANADGGLWASFGDALWYRSPGGEWFAIELPAGVVELSAALADGAGELWIAASIGGRTQVFATPAIPTAIPAAGHGGDQVPE